MTTPLNDILVGYIGRNGPMSFYQFMSFALTHPEHGYYKTRNAVGSQGDFITAPEISQIFGELCGVWGLDQITNQNITNDAGWAELGPGRGTLMSDIIRVCSSALPEKPSKWPIHLLDINDALIKEQKAKLSKFADLQHHVDISSFPKIPLLLVANEFFDALPIRQWTAFEGHWFERQVHLENGALALTTSNLPEIELDLPAPMMNEQVAEYAPELPAIVNFITNHINVYGGAALIIDYGKDNALGDSVQAVKGHKPVDVLESPGLCDLSAWVDFNAIKTAASEVGAKVFGPQNQGEFLKQLGLYQRAEQLALGASPEERRKIVAAVDRLSSPAQMGSVFKVMAILPSSYPKGQANDIAGFASPSEII